MIQYLEHKEIDKKKWDACIQTSSNRSIFVYAWYLDIVCEEWTALVLNDYEAVFPLASKSKYKISYLYQPFFTRYFGVFKKGKITEKLVSEFIEEIPSKFKYKEFCLHEENPFFVKGYQTKERFYQSLMLDRTYEEIQKKYSENAKRSIKKAVKAGLSLKDTVEPEEIVQLFRSTKGDQLEVFSPTDYKRLISLMGICISKKCAETIAVYDGDNKLSAAAFFMKDGERSTFLKSGVTVEGKASGAMYLLFDHYIKKHTGRGEILDFGGSSVESVAGFYRKFGAKDCVYLQVKKNGLPKLVNWIKSLKK